jgi:DNA-binding transcriptional ArsR family regulator
LGDSASAGVEAETEVHRICDRSGHSTLHALHGICDVWHIKRMLTTFEVLAQPIRRVILDRLRLGECLVGELAEEIGLTQPLTSKHLRVLRDGGFVRVRVDGPRRWYSLRPEPLVELDDWLTPYRWMWEAHFDRLGVHLDNMADHTEPEDEGDRHVR